MSEFVNLFRSKFAFETSLVHANLCDIHLYADVLVGDEAIHNLFSFQLLLLAGNNLHASACSENTQ